MNVGGLPKRAVCTTDVMVVSAQDHWCLQGGRTQEVSQQHPLWPRRQNSRVGHARHASNPLELGSLTLPVAAQKRFPPMGCAPQLLDLSPLNPIRPSSRPFTGQLRPGEDRGPPQHHEVQGTGWGFIPMRRSWVREAALSLNSDFAPLFTSAQCSGSFWILRPQLCRKAHPDPHCPPMSPHSLFTELGT